MTSTRAVLFDLDGTLLDTAPDLGQALNDLRREEGLSAIAHQTIRPLVSHGATALVKLGFPEATGADFESLRRRFLLAYAGRLCRETQFYEGVLDGLAHLESFGIAWGIVTNKPGWLAHPLLDQLGLLVRAAVLVCGDTLAQRKPHPAPLLHAAEQLGVTPAHCIYIGDAERDALAGYAAGMSVFVALFGYIPKDEKPREWPAKGWLETPQDMRRLLVSLRK